MLISFARGADVEENRFVNKGSWDSIHVVEAVETAPKKASYKLTTTVMLTMSVAKEEVGSTNMSGSLTRQVQSLPDCLVNHNSRLPIIG
jgi:hypothetical protein